MVAANRLWTYLDIVALMVVAAFAEESVVYNTVNVKLVQKWVAILCLLVTSFKNER